MFRASQGRLWPGRRTQTHQQVRRGRGRRRRCHLADLKAANVCGRCTSFESLGARYHFITSFTVAAGPEAVWSVLEEAEDWPAWWSWLRRVELLSSGDENGLGAVIRNRVSTPLGYRLTYDGATRRSIRPRLVEFETTGDLVGRGQFLLEPNGDGSTTLVFNWLVETPLWWMNLITPLARPVFAWNHHRIMSDFAEGVGSVIDAHVTGIDNVALRPGDPGFWVMPSP